jgi:hypothetical protein
MWNLLIFNIHIPQSGLTMPETLLLQEPLAYIPEETIREALKVILGTSIHRYFYSMLRNCDFDRLISLTLLLFQSIQT